MKEIIVNGIKKQSVEITLEDLIQLCDRFVSERHRIPYNYELSSCRYLPGVNVFNRILTDANISREDFFSRYKEYKKEIPSTNYYNDYVEKYKECSYMNRQPIGVKKLKEYNLPCSTWFIKYCPDPTVDSWNKFVEWCGFVQNRNTSKEFIIKKLKEYDANCERPITQNDLCKIGITIYYINKYWGNLNNCKRELGLRLTPSSKNSKSFDDYKRIVDSVISNLKQKNQEFITWDDIININNMHISEESIKRAFAKKNINLTEYLQENGLSFWKNDRSICHHYLFDDGENVSSSYEYDYSLFLKSINLIYNRDYSRNVLYRKCVNSEIINKTNCDYLFFDTFVVEILGFVSNKNDWHMYQCKSEIEQRYKDKMMIKERILIENNIPFLFLFPEDFQGDLIYQTKTINFIFSNLYKYQLVQK